MRNDPFIPVENGTHVVEFCSRNKDNRNIEGFRARRRCFPSDDPLGTDVQDQFDNFVSNGVEGEMCRMYVSLNAKDIRQAEIERAMWILRNPHLFKKSEAKLVSFLDTLPPLTKRWFFDFDSNDEDMLNLFIERIKNIDPRLEVSARKTPNGWGVWTNRGFDSRDLMEEWEDLVSFHRHGGSHGGARIYITNKKKPSERFRETIDRRIKELENILKEINGKEE